MLRRVAATKANASNALFLITWFMGSINIENIHPLEGGFLRLKFRRDRRPGLPIEPIWSFYPKYFVEIAVKLVQAGRRSISSCAASICASSTTRSASRYTDMAMTPVAVDEAETHELFGTDAARAYVAQAKRVKDAQDGHAHDVAPWKPPNKLQPMRASSACARKRCGRSYILPSMPTAPAPGCAAKAATTAFAFAICSGAGREHLVDHRHLRRMNGEPPAESVAAREFGVAAQRLQNCGNRHGWSRSPALSPPPRRNRQIERASR